MLKINNTSNFKNKESHKVKILTLVRQRIDSLNMMKNEIRKMGEMRPAIVSVVVTIMKNIKKYFLINLALC